MLYSHTTGILVVDDEYLDASALQKLIQTIPGDNPYGNLKGIVFLRGESLTMNPRILELARWIELLGWIRKSPHSLADIEAVILKRLGHPKFALNQCEASGNQPPQSKSEFVNVNEFMKRYAEPSTPSNSKKTAKKSVKLTLGLEVKSLSKNNPRKGCVDAIEDPYAYVLWDSGCRQKLTKKSLTDTRKFFLGSP